MEFSGKHSFTLYPFLTLTDRKRVKYTRYMWTGGTFFPVVLLCQYLVLVGNRFQFYILHIYVVRVQYSWNVGLVFFNLAGNSFWCYLRTYCTIQLCNCVSFLVVAGNSFQNENVFLQKKSYWVTLLWSDSRCVYFIRPNTLLLTIVLFCVFLLYRADPQVEVQFRILLKDKYICTIVSQKYQDLLHTLQSWSYH